MNSSIFSAAESQIWTASPCDKKRSAIVRPIPDAAPEMSMIFLLFAALLIGRQSSIVGYRRYRLTCMNDPQRKSPLRLRKKHGSGERRDFDAANGERLVLAQSMRNALIAGLIAIIVFCVIWTTLSSFLNRVFPWMTVLLGVMLGFAVRQAGRGVDWRFPLLAAVMALFGALLGNVVVAASYTAETFDTGTLQILRAVTGMTWPVFFDEVLTAADGFYAVLAAGLAAFLANRRLTRSQYYALRLWRGQSDGHE